MCCETEERRRNQSCGAASWQLGDKGRRRRRRRRGVTPGTAGTAAQGPRGQRGRGAVQHRCPCLSDICCAEHRTCFHLALHELLETEPALSSNPLQAAARAALLRGRGLLPCQRWTPQERDMHTPALRGSVARAQGQEGPGWLRSSPRTSHTAPATYGGERRTLRASLTSRSVVSPPSPPSSKSPRKH